jgi:hypothetical protein
VTLAGPLQTLWEIKRARTRNDLRRYIPRLFMKRAATRFFVYCACPGPRMFIMLSITTHVEESLGDNHVKFGEYENYWH